MGDIIYSYSQGFMTIVNKPRPRATYEVLLFIFFLLFFFFVFFFFVFFPCFVCLFVFYGGEGDYRLIIGSAF